MWSNYIKRIIRGIVIICIASGAAFCRQGQLRFMDSAATLLFDKHASAPDYPTQQYIIDSVTRILGNPPAMWHDSDKTKALCIIAKAYILIDNDKSLFYGKEAVKLARKTNRPGSIAIAESALGACYWARCDYLNALKHRQAALDIFLKNKDWQRVAKAYCSMGSIIYAEHDYDRALEYFHKALQTAETHEGIDRNLLYSRNGILADIGMTLCAKGEFEQSLPYYQRALKGNEAKKDTTEIIRLLSLMAPVNAALQHLPAAQQEADRISGLLQHVTMPNDNIVGTAYEAMAYVQLSKKEYGAAIIYFRKALDAFAACKDIGTVGALYANIGDIYLQQAMKYKTQLNYRKQYDALLHNAVFNLRKAIECSPTTWVNLKEYEKKLSEAYILLGSTKGALEAMEAFTAFNDSLFNTQVQKNFTGQLLQYEYDHQKDSLNNAHKIRQLRTAQLQKEKEVHTLYIIIGLICLLLIASFFVYRSNLKRQRLKNQLEKEKADGRIKEIEYRNMMTNISFSALQAQMNPHFIFNCLNSIKLYTEENNSRAASEYLTKFSKLIRLMLDNARNTHIFLSSELMLLHLYLEMEAMRFKNKLSYNISVDENVDADFIEIPPMLIQPYVENAIWHGLMHKKEGGTIDIHIASPEPCSMLVITVKDNGIGRKKAGEMKSKTSTQHKSYGTILTTDRINLLNEQYATDARIVITDLVDDALHACGTLVTIQLPVK
ncbi:MAG: histidine kinase [Edaphocola sp.]